MLVHIPEGEGNDEENDVRDPQGLSFRVVAPSDFADDKTERNGSNNPEENLEDQDEVKNVVKNCINDTSRGEHQGHPPKKNMRGFGARIAPD